MEKTTLSVNKTANTAVVKKEESQVERFLKQVNDLALVDNRPLSSEEKSFAVPMIEKLIKEKEQRKIRWDAMDLRQVVSQIKTFARLGLSIQNNEIYFDIRNNSRTGKYDIAVLKQYQGLEKELVKWCSKEIVRFHRDIICDGDDLIRKFDYETGIEKIIDHKKNNDIDRNKLDNIKGAYAIAYVRESNGDLVPYIALIDRNRILRAMNASPSKEKTVWKTDTVKMVLKTAVWELHNKLKPFIIIPTELQADWEESNPKMNWNDTDNVEQADFVDDLVDSDEVDANGEPIVDAEFTDNDTAVPYEPEKNKPKPF